MSRTLLCFSSVFQCSIVEGVALAKIQTPKVPKTSLILLYNEFYSRSELLQVLNLMLAEAAAVLAVLWEENHNNLGPLSCLKQDKNVFPLCVLMKNINFQKYRIHINLVRFSVDELIFLSRFCIS